MNVRRWLARAPHPAAVRADGEMIAVGTGKRRWAEVARAIEAQSPELIEALDGKGAVLRVLELELEQGDTDDSPPRGDLASLARIMADVADRAAQRHAEAYSLAFTKQLELVELVATRLQSLESAWARMVEARAEEAQASPLGALDAEAQGLIAQIVAGRLNGGKEGHRGPG